MQSIIVFIIVALAVIFAVRNVYKAIKEKKTSCDGCQGGSCGLDSNHCKKS